MNAYELLGVRTNATIREVRGAYVAKLEEIKARAFTQKGRAIHDLKMACDLVTNARTQQLALCIRFEVI